MPYPLFDRSKLKLRPISERKSLMTTKDILPLDYPSTFEHPALPKIAKALVRAKRLGASRILMMGAHVIKEGLSRFVIDLMERGIISHVAMNGGAMIHLVDLMHCGSTSEDVHKNVADGTFGLWQEYDIFLKDAQKKIGEFSPSIGFLLSALPESGNLFSSFRCNNAHCTVHLSIGQDVFDELPAFDAALWGAASYRDFLVFAESVRHLQGGVVLNIGSQVMGPEIFIKALSMARNVEHQEGRRIDDFTVAVFDCQDLGPLEMPEKTDPRYFDRPLKNLLLRSGGLPHAICGWHRATIPALRAAVLKEME